MTYTFQFKLEKKPLIRQSMGKSECRITFGRKAHDNQDFMDSLGVSLVSTDAVMGPRSGIGFKVDDFLTGVSCSMIAGYSYIFYFFPTL